MNSVYILETVIVTELDFKNIKEKYRERTLFSKRERERRGKRGSERDKERERERNKKR